MKKAICILLLFTITKNGFSQQGSDTSSQKKVQTRWVRAKDINWTNPEIEATIIFAK